MKRGNLRATFGRVTVAVFLFGLSKVADAVPIYLDFSGQVTSATIDDAMLMGSSISGGFSLETDNMFALDSADPVRNISFMQFLPGLTSDPLAYFNIGSEQLTWIASLNDDGYYNGYASVGFQDACTAGGCFPGWAENLSWIAINNDFVSDLDGTFTSRVLALFSQNTIRYPDYPFVEYLDYFDANDVTALSGVTLPLYDLTGSYLEEKFVCASGECQSAGQSQFEFSMNNVTRGVGAREVAVPEPGPLGLLAAGLLGLFVVRRRAPAAQA